MVLLYYIPVLQQSLWQQSDVTASVALQHWLCLRTYEASPHSSEMQCDVIVTYNSAALGVHPLHPEPHSAEISDVLTLFFTSLELVGTAASAMCGWVRITQRSSVVFTVYLKLGFSTTLLYKCSEIKRHHILFFA